jgi:hypothetical protein
MTQVMPEPPLHQEPGERDRLLSGDAPGGQDGNLLLRDDAVGELARAVRDAEAPETYRGKVKTEELRVRGSGVADRAPAHRGRSW